MAPPLAGVLPGARGVSTDGNRAMAPGNADSGAVKGLGKPGAGEPHARFDEGRLETGPGRPPRQSPTLPKSAELPVEQPMSLEFAVNLKTAQALGLTFPNEILLHVSEVIQ